MKKNILNFVNGQSINAVVISKLGDGRIGSEVSINYTRNAYTCFSLLGQTIDCFNAPDYFVTRAAFHETNILRQAGKFTEALAFATLSSPSTKMNSS